MNFLPNPFYYSDYCVFKFKNGEILKEWQVSGGAKIKGFIFSKQKQFGDFIALDLTNCESFKYQIIDLGSGLTWVENDVEILDARRGEISVEVFPNLLGIGNYDIYFDLTISNQEINSTPAKTTSDIIISEINFPLGEEYVSIESGDLNFKFNNTNLLENYSYTILPSTTKDTLTLDIFNYINANSYIHGFTAELSYRGGITLISDPQLGSLVNNKEIKILETNITKEIVIFPKVYFELDSGKDSIPATLENRIFKTIDYLRII